MDEELSEEVRRKRLRDQVAQTMLNELEKAGAAGQTWPELVPAARRAHPAVERHIPLAAIRSLFRRGQALKAELDGQERWFAAEYAPVATPLASVPENTEASAAPEAPNLLRGIGEDAQARVVRLLQEALAAAQQPQERQFSLVVITGPGGGSVHILDATSRTSTPELSLEPNHDYQIVIEF